MAGNGWRGKTLRAEQSLTLKLGEARKADETYRDQGCDDSSKTISAHCCGVLYTRKRVEWWCQLMKYRRRQARQRQGSQAMIHTGAER
jgi:hypothetical protein